MSIFGAPGINVMPISACTATLPAGLEIGTLWQHGGNIYQLVYNAGTATIGVNYGCIVATGATGYSVNRSSVSSVSQVAFGIVKNTAISGGTYGWVAKSGMIPVYIDGSNVTAGDRVVLANDGKFASRNTGTESSGHVIGVVVSGCSAATNVTALAYIQHL